MQGIPNNPKEFLERVNKISPEFEITGKYTKLSETYLRCKCKKCGHERNYSAKTLLETQHCRYCERIKSYDDIFNISDNEFKKRVQSKYPDLNITGTYKHGQKEITCICKKCGYKNRIRTLSLLNGSYKCTICENGKENIQIGVNDIKSINPVLYDCLVDKSINEKFTINSRNKTDFICPSCGQIIKNKTIDHVNKRGLKCKCQDGNSLGEKYLYQVLKSVDINIESEKYLNNNYSYRYDFYGNYNDIEYEKVYYLVNRSRMKCLRQTLILLHEIKGTNIKIIEKPGMRKDRFSALEYNFKITQDLSIKLKPKTQSPSDITKYFHVRAPKKSTRYS